MLLRWNVSLCFWATVSALVCLVCSSTFVRIIYDMIWNLRARFSQNSQNLYLVSGCVSAYSFVGFAQGVMEVLIWWGLVNPNFQCPLAAKLCGKPPNVLELHATTCSRSSITFLHCLPSLQLSLLVLTALGVLRACCQFCSGSAMLTASS